MNDKKRAFVVKVARGQEGKLRRLCRQHGFILVDLSVRTKMGLMKAKARGKKLGHPGLPGKVLVRIQRMLLQEPRPTFEQVQKKIKTYKTEKGKEKPLSIYAISKVYQSIKKR